MKDTIPILKSVVISVFLILVILTIIYNSLIEAISNDTLVLVVYIGLLIIISIFVIFINLAILRINDGEESNE